MSRNGDSPLPMTVRSPTRADLSARRCSARSFAPTSLRAGCGVPRWGTAALRSASFGLFQCSGVTSSPPATEAPASRAGVALAGESSATLSAALLRTGVSIACTVSSSRPFCSSVSGLEPDLKCLPVCTGTGVPLRGLPSGDTVNFLLLLAASASRQRLELSELRISLLHSRFTRDRTPGVSSFAAPRDALPLSPLVLKESLRPRFVWYAVGVAGLAVFSVTSELSARPESADAFLR